MVKTIGAAVLIALASIGSTVTGQVIVFTELHLQNPNSSNTNFGMSAPNTITGLVPPTRTFTIVHPDYGTGTMTLEADPLVTIAATGNASAITTQFQQAENTLQFRSGTVPVDSIWYYNDVTLSISPGGPIQGIHFISIGRIGGSSANPTPGQTAGIEAISLTQPGVTAYLGSSTNRQEIALPKIDESTWDDPFIPDSSLLNTTFGFTSPNRSLYLFVDDADVQTLSFRIWFQRNANVTAEAVQRQAVYSIGVIAVPEASTASLLGLAMALLTGRRLTYRPRLRPF